MAELIIKAGSFYRGNEKVRPEFGNTEQIECMRKFEALGNILKEGLVVEPVYDIQPIDVSVHFDCVCGERLYVTTETDQEDDIDCFLDMKKACGKCGRVYEFDCNDDDKLVVKLKTK